MASSPSSPSMMLSPVLPVSVLLRELPVALMSPDPVRVRFSTLFAVVKSTDVWIRSVPSELFSVTTSEVLSTI